MLAESASLQYAAFCMVKETASRLDTDSIAGYESSICKLFCTEMVCKVADNAVQIHGGAGYLSGCIERFYRDVRLLRIYEGTNELQKLMIAHSILKQY
jgi:acyl-CoA dehydrogenase